MDWRKHPEPSIQGWKSIWQILDIENDDESDKFVEEKKKEFEMSMIGEMKYFLGLQIV